MRRWLARSVGLLFVLTLAAAAVAGVWGWRLLHEPYQGFEREQRVVIKPGEHAGSILERLAAAGVLPDARLARVFLVYGLDDPPLQAGEYRFDRPLSTPQVLAKMIRGEVVTHPVTIIEGLTLDEIAEVLAREGFGDLETFRREMARGELVADLDPAATDLEGYLYPDTYSFARGTSEAEIVATLVRTFRQRFETQVAPLLEDGDERSVREIVTLASVVEKEARVADERALIAGVYAHRLRIGMPLQADPTVIYALKEVGTWDGNLRRDDLRRDLPYNTYVRPGLPPGPICSPGVASLVAAAAPADTPHLYFVSRNDGTHVFAETLREHNRNVEKWQKRYWRERWAKERAAKEADRAGS